MQARAGRGEDPANTRVLHFVHNPEAEARREHEAARIGELEAESATLRAQLQALQPKEAGGGLESMAAAVAAAEKTVLEQKVTSHICYDPSCIRAARKGQQIELCKDTVPDAPHGRILQTAPTRKHPWSPALRR